MTVLGTLVALTAFAVAARVVSRVPVRHSAVLHDALMERTIPWLAGAVAIAATLLTWGGITPIPVYHDEAAYLLQAGIFAQGRVTGSPPPIPEFFEQFHVLLSPGLTAKYPPGFALALVPGMWLRLPALVPLLLTGLTAGLGYALARRIAGGSVALLATALWLAAPGNLRWRAGFLSEILTSLVWIVGWWALLRWRATARASWLLALAACVGVGAITRPLTALVFALPVGVVVVRDVVARSAWRSLGAAMALGTAIVLLLPLHNRAVTGNWRVTPYARYTSLYLPFDRMGFGLDSTLPARALPVDMQVTSAIFRFIHVRHTAEHLPAILIQRAGAVLTDVGGTPASVAAALVLFGLLGASAAVQFATGTALLLLLAHLPYAHFSDWTLYYLEAFPVLALLLALGVARLGRLLAGAPHDPDEAARRTGLLVAAAAAIVLALLPSRVQAVRTEHRSYAASQLYFELLLREVPGRAVVFVRYGPRHVVHCSLIQNPPDYDTARLWIAYDRGPENAALLARADGRRGYLYDEERREIVPLETQADTVPPKPRPGGH